MKKIKYFLIAFIAAQIPLAFLLQIRQPERPEFFPFFSWALFAQTPLPAILYDVRVYSANGINFSQAQLMTEQELLYPQVQHKTARFRFLTNLLADYAKSNDPRLEQTRRFFELNFLSHLANVKYSLVQREFNPVELWKNKSAAKETSLGIWQMEGFGR